MKGVLQRIKPMHASLIPPDGAQPQNMLVRGGQQLFRLVRKMARSVPAFGDDGKRLVAKHPVSAEVLYEKRKREAYTDDALFTLESQGNFNVEKIPYTFPTPEELAAEERDTKIAAMGGGALGEMLVDAGLTREEIMARLMGPGPGPQPVVEMPVPGEEQTYPHQYGVGRWMLSSGESMRGTKVEAIAAEATLHEAVPEV